MIRVARWMADYYICELGQVLEGVIPAGVRRGQGTQKVTLLSVPAEVVTTIESLKLPEKQAVALKAARGFAAAVDRSTIVRGCWMYGRADSNALQKRANQTAHAANAGLRFGRRQPGARDAMGIKRRSAKRVIGDSRDARRQPP